MTPEHRDADALRIDVLGDLAAVELVNRLRWANPQVSPLEGRGWRISIARGVDCARLIASVQDWRQARTEPEAAIVVSGTVRLVAAVAA